MTKDKMRETQREVANFFLDLGITQHKQWLVSRVFPRLMTWRIPHCSYREQLQHFAEYLYVVAREAIRGSCHVTERSSECDWITGQALKSPNLHVRMTIVVSGQLSPLELDSVAQNDVDAKVRESAERLFNSWVTRFHLQHEAELARTGTDN
jgi:hypothetical protein